MAYSCRPAAALAALLIAASALPATLGRASDTGDLLVPGGTADTNGTLSDACLSAATSDLSARWALAQFDATRANNSGSFGPYLIEYAAAPAVDASCRTSLWVGERIKRILSDLVGQGLNYCHHHAPAWTPPPKYQSGCSVPANSSCPCAVDGLTTRTQPLNGVDCSNLVAFVYNFGFGYYPVSNISAQACGPYAPGRIAPHNLSAVDAGALMAGDQLYIVGSSSAPAPAPVTHVVVWTGMQVDFTAGASGPFANSTLLANVAPSQRAGVNSAMMSLLAAGKPVWVIADSHWTGPNYRPFAGWYRGAFSHARRVVNPPVTWSQGDTAVASWDSTQGECYSQLALKA